MSTDALDIPVTAPSVIPHMEQTHVRAKVTPNSEEAYTFDLAIPKDWAYASEFGPTEGGLLQTQGLGFFARSTLPDGPVIAATVTVVPFEIPIDTWARLMMVHDGWEIVSGSWFPGAYGPYYDVTGVRANGTAQEVRRTTVRVRGTHIFSLNTMCGRTHWDSVKELFWVAHSSFELTLKGPEQMEPWYGGIAEDPDFQIGYPASWSAEEKTPEPGAISVVDVRLLDKKGERLLAYLQVKAERRKPEQAVLPLEQLQADTHALLEKAGLVASAAPRKLTDEEDPRAANVEGWLGGFVCDGMMKGGRVFVRTGFLDRSGITFTFTLIGPLLADDKLIAMRGQRAFEIARESLVMPA